MIALYMLTISIFLFIVKYDMGYFLREIQR